MENLKFGEVKVKQNKKYIPLQIDNIVLTCKLYKNDEDLYVYPNKKIVDVNEQLKKKIIKHVYKNARDIFGSNKTLETLEEFYCDSIKTLLVKSKYLSLLKIQNYCTFTENVEIVATLEVPYVWVDKNSYGTCYNIVEIKESTKNPLFLEESDSDSDLHLD